MDIIVLDINLIEAMFLGSRQQVKAGLDNAMVSSRQQVIAWINDDPFH